MSIFFTIMAILSGVYYVICMTYAGIRSSFITFWLLMAIVFATFAIISRIKLKSAIIIHLFNLAKIGLALGLAMIMAISMIVVHYMNEKPDKDLDYIIVLGAQVRGNTITKSLKQRLDTAYDYALDNEETIIIVSGGQGVGENISEALAMKNYLAEKGIATDRIIMEDKSTSTKENMDYSKELLGEYETVGIVTNGFHVYRAIKIAKKAGISGVSGISAPTNRILWLNYVVRECFALVKEVLVGNI